MPRRLLRDRHIVSDDWLYVTEAAANAASPLIVSFDQWKLEPDTWLTRGSRLGVSLAPSQNIEDLATDLKHFSLIAAQFPNPSEGRGYSQARILRERFGYSGELRATGCVRADQVFFMARCGFNSFELAESDFDAAIAAFSTFSAAYQPSNDSGLAVKLPRDIPASA